MQKTIRALLCCTLGLVSAGNAAAYINSDYTTANRGFYVGIDMGHGAEYTYFDHGDPFFGEIGWQDGTRGFALGLTAGYQFNSYLALELDTLNTVLASNPYFERINNEENQYYDFTNLIDPVFSYTGIAGKVLLPINQKWRVIAKLGVGVAALAITTQTYLSQTDFVNSYTAFQSALGVAYLVNKNSEFDITSTTIISNNVYKEDGLTVVNFVTLGYSYHFNS